MFTAHKAGGRYYHFWWACIIVSLVTECVCYFMPNLNNFWHAQGVLTFVGRRFPLYIVIICEYPSYPDQSVSILRILTRVRVSFVC